MKKFILTVIFFIVGIFKPRKRILTKPKKIKKYKNSK